MKFSSTYIKDLKEIYEVMKRTKEMLFKSIIEK